MKLVKDVQDLVSEAPSIAPILGLSKFETFAELAGTLFTGLCNNTEIGNTVARVYGADASLVELTTYDITETARRNFEPGGPPATLLFSRGVHAVMAHRIANYLWTHENPNLALAFKIVVEDVADNQLVVGNKAAARGEAKISFLNTEKTE